MRLLRKIKGQGQVTKGHYAKNIYESYATHVLWFILRVKSDSDTHLITKRHVYEVKVKLMSK